MGATGLSADPTEYRARLGDQADGQIDAWAQELMRDIAIRRGVVKVVADFRAAAKLDEREFERVFASGGGPPATVGHDAEGRLMVPAVALWALVPDSIDERDAAPRSGAFLTTLVAFFLAEIGDKTQIATIGLAARFDQTAWVVLGTTLGMMLANVPAVLVGDRMAGRLPVSAIRIAAALVFAALGLITLLS